VNDPQYEGAGQLSYKKPGLKTAKH
jgi:hypothetical protein